MVDLYVAIFEDGSMFKHWALFIDDDDDYSIVQVQGNAGRWRYEAKEDYNARASETLSELVYVATIGKDEVGKLKDIATAVKFKHTDAAWNCQSWVLDPISEIGQKGLIDISQEALDDIGAKQDGLV